LMETAMLRCKAALLCALLFLTQAAQAVRVTSSTHIEAPQQRDRPRQFWTR
jgi:hypothetical protein